MAGDALSDTQPELTSPEDAGRRGTQPDLSTWAEPDPLAPSGLEPEGEDPLIGQTVAGRYHVDAIIADGGMGRVYMASDEQHGTVALKTLLPVYSSHTLVVQRFQREVTSLREAQCPHVVTMHEYGELPDGRAFFVMEFVDGVALDTVLKSLAHPMDPSRAIKIALQLCAALIPAHALGIVHRDLKPENLILCEIGGQQDVLKVLDFGIAKPLTEAHGITEAGQVLGTPTYMSPEQCTGRAVDERSDIYALGVLLYELLAGEPPFVGEKPWDVIRSHLKTPPTPLSERDPAVSVPEALERLLMRCLLKAPEQRFQTMREVHAEMGAIAAALGVEPPATAR